jgi:hypothetical protein
MILRTIMMAVITSMQRLMINVAISVSM